MTEHGAAFVPVDSRTRLYCHMQLGQQLIVAAVSVTPGLVSLSACPLFPASPGAAVVTKLALRMRCILHEVVPRAMQVGKHQACAPLSAW